MTQFTLICVNYRSEEDTERLVRSFLEQEVAGESDAIVVENERGQRGLEGLDGFGARFRMVSPGRNLGYFGALAEALRARIAARGAPDWVILSNADIVIEDRTFLRRLLELHGEDPPAVVAPAVISALHGHDQNPHFATRPSGLRMRFYKAVFGRYWLNVAYQALSVVGARLGGRGARAARRRAASKPGATPIYAPHGAFMIVHRGYFDAGGDLNHGAFLFGEEIYVAETARRLGLRVVHDPRLEVIHREHTTMGSFRNPVIARHRGEAAAYLADRFFSRR